MKFDTLDEITDRLDAFLWPDADERLRLKRRRILEAARDLMVQFGYRKTSMDAPRQSWFSMPLPWRSAPISVGSSRCSPWRRRSGSGASSASASA
jgi:hypothetical protein